MIVAKASAGVDSLHLGKKLQKIATEEAEMLITLAELVIHGSPWHELRFAHRNAMEPLSKPAIEVERQSTVSKGGDCPFIKGHSKAV